MAIHGNAANPPAVKRLVLLIGALAFAATVATAAEALIVDLRAKAEQGDASAQFNLGLAYEDGLGVAKDQVEAAKWYRKAAEQGHAKAQFNLGVAYDNGRGVAKDQVEAYAWFNLAAIKNEDGRKMRGILEKTLSRDEIAAGQRRTRELQKEIEAKRQPPKP